MAKTIWPGQIARNAVRKLNRLRGKLKPVPDGSSIHHFRVQFKKTRAFYRMANAAEKSGNHQLQKSWRKVYRATGVLRDAELLQKTVQLLNGGGTQLQYLKQQNIVFEVALQRALKRAGPFRPPGEKWKRFDERLLNDYFNQLLAPVCSYYLSPITDHQLHEIRKSLKDFLYNLQWLVKLQIPFPPAIEQVKISAVENILLLLGNYQNEVVQKEALLMLREIPELQGSVNSIDDYLYQRGQHQVQQHEEILQALEHFFHLQTPRPLDE